MYKIRYRGIYADRTNGPIYVDEDGGINCGVRQDCKPFIIKSRSIASSLCTYWNQLDKSNNYFVEEVPIECSG